MNKNLIMAVLLLCIVPSVSAGMFGPDNRQCNKAIIENNIPTPGLGEIGESYIFNDTDWVVDDQVTGYTDYFPLHMNVTGDTDGIQYKSDIPIDALVTYELNGPVDVVTVWHEGGYRGSVDKQHDAIVAVFGCVNTAHYQEWLANRPPASDAEVPEFSTVAIVVVLALVCIGLLWYKVSKKKDEVQK